MFLRQKQQVVAKNARDMNCAGFFFHSQDVLGGLDVLILGLGDAADFPAGGKFDGDVVGFAVRILEIDGVHTVGVFKHALFGGAENSGGHQGAAAGGRNPAGNFDFVFGDERLFGTRPVGRVLELHVDAGGHVVLQDILEIFPAGLGVLISPLLPAGGGFEAGVGDGNLSFEGALVGDLEIGLADDFRVGA